MPDGALRIFEVLTIFFLLFFGFVKAMRAGDDVVLLTTGGSNTL